MNAANIARIEPVLHDISVERARQHELWGVQRPDWPVWMAILTEEVGESAEAALDAHFYPDRSLAHLREELIQVAAVAVAMVEHIDEMSAK